MVSEAASAHCSVCAIPSIGTLGGAGEAETLYGTLYPVRSSGKPTGRLRGHICARCLEEANKVRHYLKSRNQNIEVSKHAIERYLERFEGERPSEESAKISILKMFGYAQRIEFKKRFMVERERNNWKPADYLFHQGWIFVVTREPPRTIVTMERQWSKRLGRDFWYTKEEE